MLNHTSIEEVKNFYPKSASIIMTFQCNAKCAECCFECGPANPFSLTQEDIKSTIDRISEIPSINFLVWTGGEVFLKYELLKFGISYAAKKGIRSRIVSNGFWAQTVEKAKKKLAPLVISGLSELNISTGDNHQEYIPFDRVMNAAVAGVELGLISVITVEKTSNSIFKLDDVYNHNLYIELSKNQERLDRFKALSTVWVSFHEDQKYEYDSDMVDLPEIANGCDNLFSMAVVDPQSQALSCCGISVEYIKELQLGEVTSKPNSLKELYDLQKYDFMKQWLYVDGPVKVLRQVKKWNPNIKVPKFYHFCQTCAYIFNSEQVKQTILENYDEIIDTVQIRFVNKIRLKQLMQNTDLN